MKTAPYNRESTWQKLILGSALCICIDTALLLGGCDTKQLTEKPPVENAVKRVAFDQLFEVNGSNVKPKTVIRYAGTTFTPDVPFEVQVMTLNNEPFSQLIGRDAEVKVERGVMEIIRFY